MKKRNISFSTVLTGFFATLLLFFSCQVGLGEAVDTRPPTITIEKPEVDKVIRDKFLISGTWEDDGTIDNVYVVLNRTDGKLLDGTSLERRVDATFTIDEKDDEKGTWQAIVDPLEENNQIIDGSYQATVYISDKGKHTTSQITTFTIDNTAPVLILSKPNSTPEDQTLSAYGQRLFLEGSIADATKDTWIQLDFYSGEECTEDQYLTTIETGMISPTDVNSNNARLAIYNTDITQQYATEYYNLYGKKTEKSGAEQVYAKLTVYDTAETFPIEGESNSLSASGKIKGNPTQSFYLTKKLAESITKSQTANGYGLAPIDIYNVLNGTYVLKNESRAADAATIKEELLSAEQKKDITVFTINPENSPYFTISGLKTLNKDGKDFEEGNTIVNGTQTIEVSVFMGSDSISLKDDENFYVYLLECDNYGKPKKEDVDANRIKLYSKYKETGSGSEKKTYYKIGGKTDHKTTSGAYVFSIPMNKSLRADPDKGTEGIVNVDLDYGKNYLILVSGTDTEGNAVEATDGGYGFCFTAGGTAPRITITEPADNTVFIKKGDGLYVKGTVSSEGGEPRFTISNDANMVDLPLTQTGESTWSFEKQIAPADLGFAQDESVIYSLIFSATRDATESTQTKSVWYDVEGPAITMSDPVPLVKTNTVKADGTTVAKDSINGKVTFSGSIIDEFDSRFGTASWKVEQNGAAVTGEGLSGTLEKNFDFTVDTTKLTDKKDAVIVISAYDYVGNLSETRYTCYVDQSTDVPKIVTTEEGKDISENADLAFVQQGNNLYQRGGSLVLSITDDDGVANARVKIEEYNNGTYIDPDEKQDISYPSPSFISHVLPNSVGIYRATVTVYDKHYVSESATQNNYKQIQFFLRVTGTGPDVSITPDKEYINNLAGGKYVLTFNVTDEGNKPYMLKMGTTTILEDVDEDSFTYEITPTTTASIKFTVIDKNSSFTEKTFVPRFDSEAPTVSIKNYPNSPSLTEDTTYLFKGDMSDTGNSGIDKVQIKFVDGEQTSTDDTGWTDCTAGSVNWNSELTWANNTVFDTEGKKTVFVKAIDGAGNEATDYKTFTYDKSKPVLTLANPLSTSETNIVSDEVGASGYVLSGTVTETNALATSNALVIKVDDQSSTITPNATTGEWSYTIAKGTTAGKLKSDASIEVELLAKDIAGKTDNKKYIIYYDTQAPELVVTAPAENEPVSTSSLAIKGTVSDNGYGVENVEYVLYSGNVTSANVASATKIQSDSKDVTSENFPIERKGEQWYIKNTSVNMPLGTTEGALTLKVKATEKTKNGHGGRTTTEYVPFYFDKANPTLTEASIGATGKTKNVGFALSGKAIDSNALASVIISWGTNNSVTLTPGEGEANEMNWSQSFVVGSETVETGTYKIADGTNEFTIVAKDITGKEKQMTRTVIVDTTKPVINATSITNSVGATIAGVSWYKNRSLSVEVTAVDANGDDGTGISMVEYSTSSDGGTTWSAWSPLSSFSNNLYKGTVSFAADGQNLKFKVHAIDVAGNESDESTITVNIDTTAPVLEALYYKKGEGTASTITSPIYIKENTKLTVYGNYKDEESGVNALTYAYGNPAIKYSTVALTETPVDSNYTLTAVTGSETSIKSWRAEFTPAESGAFTVTGSNRTGDSTNALKVFDVTVDKEAPVVDNVRLVISNSDKNAYSDGSKYYVNNSAAAGKTFKVSGVATDTVGVDSVELLITKNDSTTETKTPTRGGTLGQWYFDGIDLSDWTGTGASAKITVKDKAGNETIETLNIAFDVTAPSADHKIDDSLKNLEFRIGDAANDAGEPDVGGKYSDGTYGSALTMQIRGNFPDETNGSGINKFYYKTFNNEEVTIDSSKANGSIANGKIYFKTLDDLKDYVIANKTDVFSPLSTVEPKNVEYNVGPFVDDDNKPLTSVADTVLTNDRIRFGGNPTTPKTNGNYTVNSKGYVQFRTSVATNFKTTIKGFVEGKNYLVIVAEDNAGNAAVDYAVVSGITYPCYSLNVDITAPTIPTKPEGSLFTNLEEEGGVVIAGTVSDMPNVTNGSSGLKKIVFTRDGGTGSVEVTTFTAPTAADLTAATEVSAAYSSDTTLKHWEANIASLLPPSGMAIISAKVIDNAGFETSTPVATITVDKAGPALKVNSPSATAKVGTSFIISGTVDDGNGAGVDTTAGVELWYKVADGSWTKYGTNPTLTDQNWTCNVNASFVNDGANTAVSFKVKAKDTSGTGNSGESAELAVTVDTKAPDKGTFNVEETAAANLASTWFNSTTVNINGSFTDAGGSGVKKVYYQVKAASSANYGTEKSVTSDGSYTINIKDLAAGSNIIKIYAEDSVGNKSTAVEYTVKVDDKAPTITSGHSGVIYANSASCLVTLTVEDLGGSTIDKVMLTVGDKAPVECDLSEGNYTKDIKSLLVEGTVSVTATASDKAGNTASKVIANVMLDTTGPTVVINTPAADAKTSNSISVSGSASDGVGSGVNTSKGITLYYTTASSGATTPTSSTITSWTKYAGIQPTLTGSTWSGTFNVPDAVAGNNENTTLYISVGAVDNAGTDGNAGYSTPVKVTVDRKSPEYSEIKIGGKTLTEINASPWFKDDTLVVEGAFTDAGGSGVTTIKYRLNPDASADSDTNTTSLPTTNGTYNTNISGFVTGENTLKVWAVDAVGNTSEKKACTVQIDQTAPVVQKKSKDFDSTYLTNGSKAQKFDFYIKEGNSGIPADATEYTLKLGSSAVTLTKVTTLTDAAATGNLIVIGNAEGTGADTKYPIEIQLGTSAFTNLSGSQPVTITVKDNAGNSSVATIIGTMDIDSTPPVPSFTSPSANSKVNKEVEIKGKITEKNGIDSITLTAIYVKDDNTMTNTFTYSKGGENNTLTFDETEKEWSVTFDSNVADWNDSNTAQTWTFSITTTDEAGNTSTVSETSSRNYIIDQNSDRPVIKFSNLDISSMTSSNRVWITKEDLYASINDDDGEVKSVAISFDGTNWKEEEGSGANAVPYYTPENGLSYPIPSDKDGEQTIYFKVIDAKNTEFISSLTSDEADINAPKLAYKTTEFGDTADKYYSVIYAKVDLGDPSIPLAYYTTATDETEPVANANAMLNLLKKDDQNKLTDELTETAKQTWKDLSGVKTAVGGTTKYIYIFAKAKDANGIDTITAKFGEDSINAVYTIGTDDLESSGKGKLALFKINISSAETKDYKLELKATDNASRNITRTLDMNIDKQAPKVYIDSPSADASLYGTPGVADSNVTVRGRSDGDTEHVFMAVKKSESDTPEEDDWVDITKNSALTWNVIFNGKKGQTSQTDYYEDRYNTWVDTLYGTGTSTNINITEKPVCLYFYAIDTLGNTGIENPEKLPLTIFTQGDRPTVEITSPEKPNNNSLSTVGGIITVTGSTTIAINSVENIWLQIDPDYSGKNDGSDFAGDWETKLNTLINGMTEEQLGYKIEASGNATIGNAIKAGGSKTSWNRAINKNSEFNKRNAQDELINRTIAIRAYAVSASGKVSSCDTVVFTLDPNAPVFGQLDGYPLKLVQYTNNDAGTGDITASRLYEAGLYLKGKWWLTGSVSDDSGIASITMDNVSVMNNCTTTGDAISGKYNYLMNIPLTGEGKIEPKIVATEGATTSKTSELPIVLNFDNADPDFASTSLKTSEATQIVQSDGVYEIRGTFDDNNGSGFERIAFYVTRDGYLTDIMIPQGENIADNSYLLTGLTHTANNNKDLYWKSLAECKVQNGTEVLLKTYTMQTLPSYVRRGAVCRINNILYRINKIESNANATYPVKLTIDSKIDDASSITVDVALAQIIDNKVAEQGITDSYDTDYDLPEHITEEKFSNDDHDQMVERFNETSGEWTVSINSQNIKDGAITIHFVAYDKAGNVSYKAYNGVVSNNAPRFAGVTFGTDVNGDGKVEGTSELKTVYTGWYNATSEFKKEGVKENGKAANGNKITKWALPNNDKDITKIDDAEAPVMTVKGKIKIVPEIVGGNNGLGWKYKIGAGNYSAYHDLSTATHSGGTDVRNTATTAFEIDTPELLNNIETDNTYVFTFTISDKTGGSLDSTDNSTADLLLKFNVALHDGVPPTAGIKPFYWNGAGNGKNSLYYTGSGNSAKPAGHIELPEELPDTFTYMTDDDPTTGLYDVDPKVSGIVYLEGFAKDNVVVEKLLLRTTIGDDDPEDFVEIAVRDRTNNSATYGQFITSKTLAANGMEYISSTEKTITEGGIDYNVVDWKIAIDTAVIADAAATDIKVEVQAKDRGEAYKNGNVVAYRNPSSSAASELQTGLKQNAAGTEIDYTNDTLTFDNTVQTPYYKVDVVPYITKLYTGVSDSAGSEFARSATGRYIVRVNETVKLYGFNLAVDDAAVTIGNASVTPTAGGTDSDGSYLSLSIGDNSSGAVSITVNGVESLNNINGNPTFVSDTDDTITSIEYNSQADNITNNRLTDDVELWVWTTSVFDNQMNTKAITSPMLKFDASGNYYISYGRGSNMFAIDKNGAKTDLEVCYNKYHNTNVAFDSDGNFYGVGTNTDRVGTARVDATSFTFFSRALGKTIEHKTNDGYAVGSSNTYISNSGTARANYYNGTNKRRLELNQYGGDNGSYNINRVQRPKLIASGNTSSATIYLAYYDASANNIKFRYGTVTGTETANNTNRTSKMTGGFANDLAGNGTDTGNTASSASNYHLIANSADGTTFKSGEYTAIGYTSEGAAVIAWYDSKARRIVYSYNDDPETVISSMTDNTWQSNAVYLDTQYTGWYVDLAVDDVDGVHIAYYNSKTGDLKYAYIPTYDGVSRDNNGNLTGATVVTVDSYLSVGTNITINVRKEGNVNVPYIYYYNTSSNQTMNSIKIAWQNETTLRDGAINDKFTGAWESMTIPTQNIPVDATVCGGVPTSGDYKDTAVLGYMTDVYYEKAYIKGNIK